MRVTWLVLLAGCGRLAFEPVPAVTHDGTTACASAVGHDEDGDGVDDACDGCPHLFTAEQSDRDGDGVGDECDPEPDIPRQRIAFFDPFVGGAHPEWSFPVRVQPTFVTGEGRDSLRADTLEDFFVMKRDDAPADDVYAIGGRITMVGPGDRQLTIQPGRETGVAYYCEIISNASVGRLAFTYTLDGMTYVSAVERPIQPLDVGAFTLTMQQRPPDASCATTWPPQQELTATIPMGITPVHQSMFISGMVVELDYYLQIRTD